MKTKKFFMLAVLVALGFTACNEMDDMPGSGTKSNVPVRLTATTLTADVTRAAQDLNEGYITSGENISVKVGSSTYTYQAGAAGALTDITGESASDKAYYPAEGSVDIYAWYPAGASTSGSVNADQTSDANYKASDVMFASPGSFTKAQGATPVPLAFSHQMAKIEVNVTAGAGVGAITGVTLKNVNRAYNFNQTTGDVTTSGSTLSDITMTNNGAVVFPAQTHDASALLAISTEGGTATYTLDTSKEFQAGKRYVMNITVTAQAVGATTSIGAWSNDAGVINVGSQGELTIAAIAAQTYTGSAITPSITVSDGGNAVASGNYQVYYTNNINAGTATVYAVGKNTYAGKVGVKEFTINKATGYVTLSATSATKSVNTSGSFTVSTNHGGTLSVAKQSGTALTFGPTLDGSTVSYTAPSSAGSTVIRVTCAESANYLAATADFTLTTIAYRLMADATGSDVGKVICSNGHIHNNVSGIDCGGSASAMIAYVGSNNGNSGSSAYSSTYNHGLAIALADVINTSGDKQTSTSGTGLNWANASTACGAYKGAKPAGVTWQLPTAYQWERMLIGCGSGASFISSESNFSTDSNSFGYGNFRTKLTNCGSNSQGVYDVQSFTYWSATESSAGTSTAWVYNFNYSKFNYGGETNRYYVRPCFAF